MFATKPLLSNSNHSKLHLPPVNKSHRRRLRPPPTPSYPSSAAKAAHIAENVSALKAKYAGYATWLKTPNRNSREPVLTHELLKSSLCQMGIDAGQAEKLVSKCSWYVYQFQKNLRIHPEQKHRILEIERQKSNHFKNISKKQTAIKDPAEDSTTTITSLDKEGSVSSNPLPRIRSNHSVLPGIRNSGSSTSSRFRRVDFGNEQAKTAVSNVQPSHWQTTLLTTRNLTKLEPLPATEPLDEKTNSSTVVDLSSQQGLRRHGLVAGHLRSILRKQASTASSVTSTEISSRKNRSRVLTPSSTVLDDIPLGTRSQRLFGGSACFAQIMNELEQQKKHI